MRIELETYYYNAGALMAPLFALGGNDFYGKHHRLRSNAGHY
jgi:hypothetical protein